MQLLLAVINDPERVDDILTGFIELGITGATVLNSEGMARVLTNDIPIFAGLQTLITRSRPENRTILSVIEVDKVDAALALLKDVCGDFDRPATGIAFTLPVARVVGLSPELDEGNDAV